jgi:amino acid transporter
MVSNDPLLYSVPWLIVKRKHNGRSLDELPYKAAFGIWGSYFVVLITVLALLAQFYVALYPVGGGNLDAITWFQAYLAGPLLVFLYLVWKVYSWFVRPADRPLWVKTSDIDILSGMRDLSEDFVEETAFQGEKKKKGPLGYVKGALSSIF